MNGNYAPDLVDNLDGTEYKLTAPRTQVTWHVQRGAQTIVQRKRVRRGEVIKGVPEYNLAKLVELGHAVPSDEYDPQKIADEKMIKRLKYDQNAASSAMLEFTLEQNRRARAAGGGEVGLEDTGREVDGIPLQDVDPDSGTGEDEGDDDLANVPDAPKEGEEPADYRSMTYPELQQYAKNVTGSGAGGKEEIVARLDDHFGK